MTDIDIYRYYSLNGRRLDIVGSKNLLIKNKRGNI